MSLNNLARLVKDTNRLTEAVTLMRRALLIDEVSFGKNHPCVARDLNNVAQLLEATVHLAEAEPLMRRTMEVYLDFTQTTGHQHPHLHASVRNYAGLLMEMGDKQAQAWAKINAILAPVGGIRTPDV